MVKLISELFRLDDDRARELDSIYATYSPSTVDLIMSNFHHPDSRPTLLPTLITTADEQTVREVMHLIIHLSYETGPTHENMHQIIGIIRGLHQYEQYKNTPLETLTGEDLNAAIALLTVTSTLLRYYSEPPLHLENPDDPAMSIIYFKNPSAVSLIIKYRHRAKELVSFLTEHRLSMGARAIQGLPYLRWYQNQSLDNVTDDTIDTAFNYLRVTQEIPLHMGYHGYEYLTYAEGNPNKGSYLDSPELEDFIEQNPELVKSFIEYLRERKTVDIKGLKEYIDNGTALKIGIL